MRAELLHNSHTHSAPSQQHPFLSEQERVSSNRVHQCCQSTVWNEHTLQCVHWDMPSGYVWGYVQWCSSKFHCNINWRFPISTSVYPPHQRVHMLVDLWYQQLHVTMGMGYHISTNSAELSSPIAKNKKGRVGRVRVQHPPIFDHTVHMCSAIKVSKHHGNILSLTPSFYTVSESSTRQRYFQTHSCSTHKKSWK